MKKFLIILCLTCISQLLWAQDGITLHFMRLNPYSTYSNPSVFLPYTGHVGMPAVSNINAALINTSAQYKTLFGTNQDGTITTIQLGKFADQLSKRGNALNCNIALNIIDFGFNIKNLRFDFSYRFRFDEYLTYNKDMIALPAHGNMQYANAGQTARPEFRATLNAYQEISLGIQAEISPKLYIGARPKILFGLAHVKTRNAHASLYTNPDDYSLLLNYNLDTYFSCAIPYHITSDSTDIFDFQFDPDDFRNQWQNAFKNVGAAIDLGFTYRFNNHWGLAASVLDLGFIRWKTNNSRIYGHSSGNYDEDGSFLFEGLTDEDLAMLKENPQAFKKTILGYFPLEYQQTSEYTSALSGRFMIEGYYNLAKHHRFSALFQGRIVNKQFMPSFTVAWDGNFLDIFDLCVSYTLSKQSYSNIGVGIGFNLWVFQIYAATDNILGFCNSKSPQRSILNARNANLQVGIVFDWGKHQEQKIEKKNKQFNNQFQTEQKSKQVDNQYQPEKKKKKSDKQKPVENNQLDYQKQK